MITDKLPVCSRNMFIIRIQHDRGVRRCVCNELKLPFDDRLETTEALKMSLCDTGEHGDMRRSEFAQSADIPLPIRSHFNHKDLRLRIEFLQYESGDTDRRVDVAGSGKNRELLQKKGRDDALHRRLAVTAGDADNFQIRKLF